MTDDKHKVDERLEGHLSEGARQYFCELARTHPEACDRITEDILDYIATHPTRAGHKGDCDEQD